MLAIARGLRSAEIAQELGISELTVRNHRKNAIVKLSARSGGHLVALAIANRVIRVKDLPGRRSPSTAARG